MGNDVATTIPISEADVSLARGGPLYQLFLRYRLSREPIDIPHWRTILPLTLTMMPLNQILDRVVQMML
jgi:hypothetical protein